MVSKNRQSTGMRRKTERWRGSVRRGRESGVKSKPEVPGMEVGMGQCS